MSVQKKGHISSSDQKYIHIKKGPIQKQKISRKCDLPFDNGDRSQFDAFLTYSCRVARVYDIRNIFVSFGRFFHD